MANAPRTKKAELFGDVEVPKELEAEPGRSLKPCNLCGSSRAKLVYRQSLFPVRKCRDCGLVFADEHFRDEDLKKFYSGDYYERAYVCHPTEVDGKLALDYLRSFREHVTPLVPKGKVLDFGCARGTFLEAMGESDIADQWERDGVDINADEIAMGIERKLPVREADLFTMKPEVPYDAATAFSVLEHMQDPRETLEALGRVMRPDGVLLLIVPNANCLIIDAAVWASRIFGRFAQKFADNVFHEEHLYYFNKKTLPKMLSECGFETTRVGYAPSYLESYPTGPLVAVGSQALRFASWVTRRQTMLVVSARKK